MIMGLMPGGQDQKTGRIPVLNWIDIQPAWIFVLVAATLGLAPFFPEPHIWEKLKMLFGGTLTRPVDIFDFLLHGLPWVLLILKLIRMTLAR